MIQKPRTLACRSVGWSALALAIAVAPLAAESGGTKTATSVWWVVFNYPEFCATSPCKGPDHFNPAVGASAFNATGALVDADDRVTYVTTLYETSSDFENVAPYTSLWAGPGLVNPQGAEFHVVVRSHGPAIPGLEADQMTLFLEPGCQELGGPNVCKDVQGAIHLADGGLVSGVQRLPLVTDRSIVSGASSMLIRGDGWVKLILQTRLD
jgi:hypothetical protein